MYLDFNKLISDLSVLFACHNVEVICWLFITEPWVQLWVTSYKIHVGQSDRGVGFSLSFCGIPLLIIISSLRYIFICHHPFRYAVALTAAHYHILNFNCGSSSHCPGAWMLTGWQGSYVFLLLKFYLKHFCLLNHRKAWLLLWYNTTFVTNQITEIKMCVSDVMKIEL